MLIEVFIKRIFLKNPPFWYFLHCLAKKTNVFYYINHDTKILQRQKLVWNKGKENSNQIICEPEYEPKAKCEQD